MSPVLSPELPQAFPPSTPDHSRPDSFLQSPWRIPRLMPALTADTAAVPTSGGTVLLSSGRPGFGEVVPVRHLLASLTQAVWWGARGSTRDILENFGDTSYRVSQHSSTGPFNHIHKNPVFTNMNLTTAHAAEYRMDCPLPWRPQNYPKLSNTTNWKVRFIKKHSLQAQTCIWRAS